MDARGFPPGVFPGWLIGPGQQRIEFFIGDFELVLVLELCDHRCAQFIEAVKPDADTQRIGQGAQHRRDARIAGGDIGEELACALVVTQGLVTGHQVGQQQRQHVRIDARGALVGTGGTRMVPMMKASGTQRYTRGDTYVAVDLPYGNEAFSATFVLPTEGRSVDELVASLDDQQWSELVSGLQESRLDLAVPRFRLEYEQELSEPLQAMGMQRAFVPNGANFSGMSASHGEELYLSSVLQKTFVEVNEEGTEAAAATSVGVSVTSLPPTMRIDRPFLFAIRENFSGAILFIGKIVDPG